MEYLINLIFAKLLLFNKSYIYPLLFAPDNIAMLVNIILHMEGGKHLIYVKAH